MMRWLISSLLVLNLATLAWQWDAFARWGWGPHTHQEPERLLKQIRPEALKIERPSAADSAATSAGTSTDAVAPDMGTTPKTPTP